MTEPTSLNQQLGVNNVTWKLSDLYSGSDDSAIQIDIDWCKQEAAAIKTNYYQKVKTLSARELFSLVQRLEKLDSRLTKLATYSFLNFATQLDNADAGALDQKIRETNSEIEVNTVFFELEWNNLDDAKAKEILTDNQLATYKHYLLSLRRNKPHLLSETEEKLLLEREVTGRRSWITLFDKVITGHKFGKNNRTEEEVLADLHHKDRDVRRTAAREMTEGLEKNNHILTHIFNTLAADKMVTDRQRNYGSWISSMNLHNELEDKTVETLVTAVTSRYDMVERYYNTKKELLGFDTLYDYDRYAPLPSLPTEEIAWDKCKETVLQSFKEFSPEMANIAADFFDREWIHAPIQPAKQGGAFAHPCVPEVHPYVLVNYTGSHRDISTVAHELGHGVHQVLAASMGHFNSDTPLPLAETASVFAELLVFYSQLKQFANEQEKKAFICQKLESIFATVFRQTAMNRFEDAMHNGRREHGELSPEKLSEYWLQTQRAMFGNSVELSKDYGVWWSYIPHFLSTPGYVYSYAFGELLVLALYGLYKEEGDSFVPKYLTLLSAGGSESPYELLRPFGIDLNSMDFWNKGLQVIEKMLQSVE